MVEGVISCGVRSSESKRMREKAFVPPESHSLRPSYTSSLFSQLMLIILCPSLKDHQADNLRPNKVIPVSKGAEQGGFAVCKRKRKHDV